MSKPATLSLGVKEWRSLLLINIEELAVFIQPREIISTVEAVQLHQHMDRMKALISAWNLAGLPKPEPVVEAADVPVKTNGHHEPVKRKRGWPAGKPRKRLNPAVVQ